MKALLFATLLLFGIAVHVYGEEKGTFNFCSELHANKDDINDGKTDKFAEAVYPTIKSLCERVKVDVSIDKYKAYAKDANEQLKNAIGKQPEENDSCLFEFTEAEITRVCKSME